MTAIDYSHLVGHRFPGGSYTLAEHVNWLWEDAILAEHAGAPADPSIGYYLAMAGLGVSIGQVMALLDGSPDSGVMFGENELEFHTSLRAGATYDCEGEITGVERKEGKRAGVFDKLTFRVRVSEQGASTPSVVCTNTWIFPRREATGG
jgi:hypothetical protein